MLEFLVLGQIPGTQIQITYAWYMFTALGLLAYGLHRLKKTHSPKQSSSKQLRLFS